MGNDQLVNDFAKILEISPSLLTKDYILHNAGTWDSVACVSLMATIDRHYDIMIDGAVLLSATTFGDILQLIDNYEKQK